MKIILDNSARLTNLFIPKSNYLQPFLSVSHLRWLKPQINPAMTICNEIEKLRMDSTVECISMNSTLGKHLPNQDFLLSHPNSLTNQQEPVTNNLDRNGSGLIICTREEREDWEIQLEDAMFLLQNQLGLEVNSLKEIEKKMTTYTANYGHPQKIWDPDHTFCKSLVGKFILQWSQNYMYSQIASINLN